MVGAVHMMAMRALLTGRWALYKLITDRFTTADLWTQGWLISATLWIATEQRFANPDTVRVDVADFVAGLRTTSPDLADMVDPRPAERMLLAVVTDEEVDDLDDEIKARISLPLLAGLIADARPSSTELDALLAEARELADDVLADNAGPDPEPDGPVSDQDMAAVRALLSEDADEFNRITPNYAPGSMALAAAALVLAIRRRFATTDNLHTDVTDFVSSSHVREAVLQLQLDALGVTFDPRVAELILLNFVTDDRVEIDHVDDLTKAVHHGPLLLGLITEAQLTPAELDALLTEARQIADTLDD